VQHLGYLEFGELRRVALRTIEQRQILINNLAIRRATEELKVTRQYDQLCRVLAAAFEANDFDAFDLNVQLSPEERAGVDLFQIRPLERDEVIYHWDKAGSPGLGKSVATWKLNLDLITTGDQYRGMLTIYRLYTHRDLQLDLNLLISIFPVALADALDRAFGQSTIVIPRSESAALVAVQAS
jgi:hypothetical protein